MAKKKAASPTMLLSDDSTIELVLKAQGGNRFALEALLQRCLPSLRRWAHSRLPPAARDTMNTEDLVQEVALKVLVRLDRFEPRHVGSMQAFLRKAVVNKIRDEVRRVSRRPIATDLSETIPSDKETPEEIFIRNQAYDRYRSALIRLTSKDRELVVARIEAQWAIHEIMDYFGFATIAAARMAVTRAERRLMKLFEGETSPQTRKTRPPSRSDC
jgi:RNA polymerase sigma factor (sigma-70 family)